MRTLSIFLISLLAGTTLACGAEPGAPGTDSGVRGDGGTERSDGSVVGSALPVRCPGGASDPVCQAAGAENPVGDGPRPRAQVGLTPMLTGGIIDAATERLIIGGAWGGGAEATGAVLAIDLTTGDRTVISGSISDPRTGVTTVGEGPALGQVHDVGMRSDGDLVALSRVSTDRLELVRIDASTGARTMLWYNELVSAGNETSARCTDGAGRDIPNFDAESVALGAGDEMFLVARPADPSAGAIVSVSADGSSCAIVSFSGTAQPEGAPRGTGPAFLPGIRGLRFAAGRVYASQFTSSSVIAFDVATGNREIVSSHSSSAAVGAGGELGFSRLAVDASGGRLLTIDDETGGFTRFTEVDLASGDRTVTDLVSNTANAPGEGGVWFHPSRPLYVSVAWHTAVVLVDPVVGEANILSN